MALQIGLNGLENLVLDKKARVGMPPVPAHVCCGEHSAN